MSDAAKAEIRTLLYKATPEEPRHSENSVLTFADGRLLLAWTRFCGNDWHDEGGAHIAGRWSEDEGRSWGEPFILQENIGGLNCMSASLLRLPSGRILLAFGRKDSKQILHAMVKHSDDEGRTWSQPHNITRGDGYWCITNDRLLRTSAGRLLYPIKEPVLGCHAWLSDDDGRTWRMSGNCIKPAEGIRYAEPALAELAGGRIMMYIRTSTGNIHVAMSDDGGESWQPYRNGPSDMAGKPDAGPNSAEAPCLLKRIPDTGDLLMIWNNNRLRTPLTAAISSDDGESWAPLRNLEEMDGWPPKLTHCYPSIAFLNGNVHMTYWQAERVRESDYMMSLIYRRLPLEWFYGK